jgi:hypothetical protein
MRKISPLFAYAHDGVLFHKAVMKRLLKLPDIKFSTLCEEAKIDFSTAWRWQRGSTPTPATVNTIERAFNKFERRFHITSSTESPTARL